MGKIQTLGYEAHLEQENKELKQALHFMDFVNKKLQALLDEALQSAEDTKHPFIDDLTGLSELSFDLQEYWRKRKVNKQKEKEAQIGATN